MHVCSFLSKDYDFCFFLLRFHSFLFHAQLVIWKARLLSEGLYLHLRASVTLSRTCYFYSLKSLMMKKDYVIAA